MFRAGKAVAAILARLDAPRQLLFWSKLLFMMTKRSQLLLEVVDIERRTLRRRQQPLKSPSSETVSEVSYA
jgi:hypothetical protein